jgi:small-conductance mechanosensitive channel
MAFKQLKKSLSKTKKIMTLESIKVTNKSKLQILYKVVIIIFLSYIKTKINQLGIEINALLTIQIIDIIIMLLVIYLIINLSRTIFVSIYRKKYKYENDQYDNLMLGFDKIFQLLTLLGIFLLVLFKLGVDFNKFLTTFALFTVGTAIIFKENISNIIDGMIIMFSNEIQLKEIIQIGEYKGKIIDINFLYIELKTGDGNIVFIPNAKVLNSEIINFSKSNIKTIRNKFYLDFGFFGKIDQLEDEISKELEKQFKEISGLNSVEIEIEEIRFNRVKVNLLITVSKYTLQIDTKISKVASRFILDFVHKHKKSAIKK